MRAIKMIFVMCALYVSNVYAQETNSMTAAEHKLYAISIIEKATVKIVREAGLKHSSGCNIAPAKMEKLQIYHDYEITGPETYKKTCLSEVKKNIAGK